MATTNAPIIKFKRRMTREEAIQILSTRDAHGVLCGYTSGVTEALDMAIEALQNRPKGDWIPCSERFPSDDEQVIISVCDDYGDTSYWYTAVGWRCEKCWISDNDYVCGTVIAWQPLPTPYKGGDAQMNPIPNGTGVMQQSRHDDGKDLISRADAVGYETTATINEPISIQSNYVYVVRCKDCRYADECHKSVQYTRNEPRTVTIGYSPIEWCSHGEIKGSAKE